ncbi:LOW QUALITY PROTEIN: hypothetical protein NC652_013054 [Populus alba x Populus x berolinensis]|nr:LOW QUALITY PROTEIN: hypothetical protein NC652_013054 [Populus alba x Populus x berolinensis]
MHCLSGCCCFFGLGLCAQVLPNMVCNWLRLKKNESRCHQNNLWTNHFVSPRLTKDRDRFPPNNILFMLFGAGLLWMSWTCFNGGDPCVVSTDASLAVLNTVDFECFHYELKQCFSLTIHRKISECLNAYIRMQILLQRLEKFLLNPIRSTKNDEWARMWKSLKEVENFFEFQYPSREVRFKLRFNEAVFDDSKATHLNTAIQEVKTQLNPWFLN